MKRKVTRTGPATLTTSLPAAWVKEQGLAPGDEINLEQIGATLLLSPPAKPGSKSITLAYNPLLIESMLEKLYWEGYTTITIHDDKPLPGSCKQLINGFPGLEITDEEPTRATITRLSTPSIEKPQTLLRRIFILIHQSLEKNPPQLASNLLELLHYARLNREESRLLFLLNLFVSSLQTMHAPMYDDAYGRMKDLFMLVYRQKYSFTNTVANELAKKLERTEELFDRFIMEGAPEKDIRKLHHGFEVLQQLSAEVIRQQSITELATTEKTARPKKTYRVGVCLKNQSNAFWGIDVPEGMEAGQKEYPNIDILIESPPTSFDIKGQEKILEKYVNQQVDAIIMSPIHPSKLKSMIKKIEKKNIPLIVLDTDIDVPDIKYTFIGFDNNEGGKMTAEHLKPHLPATGNIVIIEGHEAGNFSERVTGFIDTMGKQYTYEVLRGEFLESIAYQKLLAYAKKHKIIAVFAASDNMSAGALTALKELNIHVPVCGFDATKQGMDSLRAGKLLSTVDTHPRQLGQLAVQAAHDLLTGKAVADRTEYKIHLITK